MVVLMYKDLARKQIAATAQVSTSAPLVTSVDAEADFYPSIRANLPCREIPVKSRPGYLVRHCTRAANSLYCDVTVLRCRTSVNQRFSGPLAPATGPVSHLHSDWARDGAVGGSSSAVVRR